MKIKNKINLLALSLAAISLGLTGCGQNESEVAADPASSDPAAAAAGANILLTEAPASAIPVGQARLKAQPGDEVAIIGQVGGVRKPIAEDYASFVIADEAVYFCDEMADEGCATPWDACCEDPEKLAANRASVVFLDAQGQAMPVNLKKAVDLTELNLVTVKGVVAPESTPENLIIHASGLYTPQLKLQ